MTLINSIKNHLIKLLLGKPSTETTHFLFDLYFPGFPSSDHLSDLKKGDIVRHFKGTYYYIQDFVTCPQNAKENEKFSVSVHFEGYSGQTTVLATHDLKKGDVLVLYCNESGVKTAGNYARELKNFREAVIKPRFTKR